MKISINFKYLRDVLCQLGLHNWTHDTPYYGLWSKAGEIEAECLVCYNVKYKKSKLKGGTK